MSIKDSVDKAVQGFNNFSSELNSKLSKLNAKFNGLKLEIPLIIDKSKDKTFYIDSKIGIDTNIGSKTKPLKTIKAALEKSYINDKVTIYLKKGQTFIIGGFGNVNVNVESKEIYILSYGNDVNKPVLKGNIAKFQTSGKYHCSAFEAKSNLDMYFYDIIIETGKLNTDQINYSSNYGGFFTRSSFSTFFKKFKLRFYKCEIKIQDIYLTTNISGFTELEIIQCKISKEGSLSKVIYNYNPKICTFSDVRLHNFDSKETLESLFGLRDGWHIKKVYNIDKGDEK